MELANALQSDVALIHVVDPAVGLGVEGGISAGELVAMAEQDAKGLLASVASRAGSKRPAREFVPVGNAAAEIVKTAKDWPADLIVIGGHGRGRIERALLGSVADAVLRHAPCPVLIVPPEA